jgi:predicted nucleic-acid-binding protein
MIVAPDTNVLVRAATDDDPKQSALARKLLAEADEIHLATAALCEFVWVMTSRYGRTRAEVSASLRSLLASPSARYDETIVDVCIAMLDRGGDFADGVIAAEGAAIGGGVFVSFDKAAVRDVKALGLEARVAR